MKEINSETMMVLQTKNILHNLRICTKGYEIKTMFCAKIKVGLAQRNNVMSINMLRHR